MPDLIEDNNPDNKDDMINNFHYNFPNNLMGGVNLNLIITKCYQDYNNNVRMGIDMNLVSNNIKLEKIIFVEQPRKVLKNDNMKILNCVILKNVREWLSENKKCPVCMIELNELNFNIIKIFC